MLIGRDRCPTIKGTTDDGCLDGDRDGVSDAVDACATVAGNGRDGCPQPLKATFSNLWTNYARGSRVERLQVKAPRGAMVQWRCKGKGCKRRSATFPQKRSAESLLKYVARNRMLARGAVIEVRVTGAADPRHLHAVRDPRQAPEPAPHGPLHHGRGQAHPLLSSRSTDATLSSSVCSRSRRSSSLSTV